MSMLFGPFSTSTTRVSLRDCAAAGMTVKAAASATPATTAEDALRNRRRCMSESPCDSDGDSLPSATGVPAPGHRSEEHTSELQSLMRISYAVFCLKKKIHKKHTII